MTDVPKGDMWQVESVDRLGKSQIIVHMRHERTGATSDAKGSTYCLRIPLTAASAFIGELVDAYAETMRALAIDLAAGGCRTCDNTRRVNRGPLGALMADPGGEPCPVCIPSAEKRLRERVMVPRDAS